MPEEMKRAELTPEQAQWETALGGLLPAVPRLDRDAVLFAAGKAAAQKRVWPWQAVAAASLMAAACMALRPTESVQDRQPQVVRDGVGPAIVKPSPAANPAAVTSWQPTEMPAARTAAPDGTSYLELRHRVLTYGVSALPAPPAAKFPAADELNGTWGAPNQWQRRLMEGGSL